MFESVKSFLGLVNVVELNNVITVSGLRTSVLKDSIRLSLGGRINIHMFTYDTHSFSFDSFFAPDVLFTINRLLETPDLTVSVNTLTKIRNKLLENTYLKNISAPVNNIFNKTKLKNMHRTPLDYQQEFFDQYIQNTQTYNLSGYLLAATAGSGKTYTALALSECIDVDQIVIVCPKPALQRVWEDNIQNQYRKQKTYWLSSFNKDMKGDEELIVVHYEYLEKMLDSVYLLKGRKVMVILDESHNLNETSSGRTNNFIALCRRLKSKHVLWLSGTPIKALAVESIPLLRCIDPLFTVDVEEKFKKIYRGDNNKAVEILNHRLGLISFKVGKERLKLSPPIFHQIDVSFKGSEEFTLPSIKKQMILFVRDRKEHFAKTKDQDHAFFFECLDIHKSTLVSEHAKTQYKTYRTNLETIVTVPAGDLRSYTDELFYCNRYEKLEIMPSLPETHRKKFKEIKSIYKYLHLKIQGECLGLVVARARINCHREIAKHIDYNRIVESTPKKTVIFTSFTEVIDDAMIALKKLELNPVAVYGKTSSNLNEIITKFDKDPTVNPLIATYATLSTAVPLTMADTMILVDSPFRDYILQQAVSRIHRLGSDTQTNVYITSLDTGAVPNISSRTNDILKWSQQQTSEILGIKSPFDLEDLNPGAEVTVESLDDTYSTRDPFVCYLANIEGDAMTISHESMTADSIPEWNYQKHSGINKTTLYHGSSKLISGKLEPRPSNVIGGKKAVFATINAAFAISFCSDWTDDDIEQGITTTKLFGTPIQAAYLKEKKKKAFEEFFCNRSGYIYLVNSQGFKSVKGLTNYEYINDNSVDIVETYFVKDLYEALKELKIDLVPYGQVVI